jgi:hypothetical protein
MPFSNAGIVDPPALSLLGEVLARFCFEHPAADRSAVAAKLLVAYRSGVHSEADLLQHLSVQSSNEK